MNGVHAFSTYVPGNLLTRAAVAAAWPQLTMAGQSKTVPSLDEDSLTMAAQASLQVLDGAGIEGGELAGVLLATTTSPYVAKSGAAVVADYVNAPASACAIDFGSSFAAGLQALLAALRDTELAARGPILVAAADAPRGAANDPSDFGYGAAAAAFLVTADGFAELRDFRFGHSSFGLVWQPAGETELRRYDDDRFDRFGGWGPQMTAAVEEWVGTGPEEPDLYALALPPNGRAEAALSAAGASSDRLVGAELVTRIGDSGCANALLNLALALERAEPDQTVLTGAYGPGAGTVTGLLAIGSSAPAGRGSGPSADAERVELSYVQYAKHRGLLPLTELPDFGAPWPVSPAWEREKDAVVGLHAGRCTNCGSLNFPPRDYCLDCRHQEFERVALPRRATILTYNVQFVVGIGPEEAPLPICTALLDGEEEGRYGGKVAALVTDTDPEAIEIGGKVELIPRRGDVEQGLVKYGWKFLPKEGSA